MVFVVDDLLGWLVGLLADAGRKKLVTRVLGTDQERALRPAVKAAVEATAAQLAPSDEQAERLAMAVGEVFRDAPKVALAGQKTLLEALQAGIAARLAVLDDPDATGIGQSSMELLGVSAGVLAETLAGHLVHEITVRGAQGGPLTPLADQLNHDVTHLQGQRLEGMLAQVVGLVTALAQSDGGPSVPRKPVRLPPRPVLAGREGLLADLDTQLIGGDDSGPRMAALWGLGGAGKTSVAVEYAHRHVAEVGVAWKFPAEDATVMAAGFAELAAQLGAQDRPGSRDPVASVHAVLAASPADWLLVFDNAPGRAAVEAFLPPAGPGRVLVTSQSSVWPPGWAVEVPALDTQVAAEFLVTRTGDADQQAARELATQLGGLPLALEQAAAYIQATRPMTSLAKYVALFRDRRADLLARGETAEHPDTVAATLGLALSRLGDEAPAAVGLVRLLACLAPEPVPLALLLADARAAGELAPGVADTVGPLLDDPVAMGDAVAALRRYSLVTPDGDAVLVHRLVQAITLDQVPAGTRPQWEQAAATLVEAAIPADALLPEAWPACAMLLPHARATLDLTSDGMWQIARYLGHSGSYPAARDLVRLIADAHKEDDAYGAEHPRTVAARHNFAHWTGMAGHPADARDLFTALLPIRDRVSGPEHLDTLNDRFELARWTGEAGDAVAARDQLAELLPIFERVSGPERWDTLAARHELASWTGEAGDAAAARDGLAQLLRVRELVVSDPEHPATLAVRGNLARWTGEAGNPAAARDQLAALLPVRERVFGPDHPDTLAARASLAGWTGQAGDPAAARDQYAALLPVNERVLGPEHPATLDARADLAHWTGRAGDAAAARDQYAALLPVNERVLGPDHPATLAARVSLARWTGEAGDPAAARDLLAALLPLRERILGPEHPSTLNARDSLARWTGEAGDAAAARDLYAELLPIRERVSGPEHPTTLDARAHLAHWTGEAGDPAAARDLLAALLPLHERVLGPEHPDTLMTCASLAHWTVKPSGGSGAARSSYC